LKREEGILKACEKERELGGGSDRSNSKARSLARMPGPNPVT